MVLQQNGLQLPRANAHTHKYVALVHENEAGSNKFPILAWQAMGFWNFGPLRNHPGNCNARGKVLTIPLLL